MADRNKPLLGGALPLCADVTWRQVKVVSRRRLSLLSVYTIWQQRQQPAGSRLVTDDWLQLPKWIELCFGFGQADIKSASRQYERWYCERAPMHLNEFVHLSPPPATAPGSFSSSEPDKEALVDSLLMPAATHKHTEHSERSIHRTEQV